jgi:hypothetical protein
LSASRFYSMKQVREITFYLGPPGPEEEKLKYEEWSKNSGTPAGEIWIEVVHAYVQDLSRRESPESSSAFEDVLSSFLETLVRVDEPRLTKVYSDDAWHPAVVIVTDEVTGTSGEPVEVDWSSRKIQELIGSAFGYMVKAEWVKTIAIYDS